MYLLVHRENVVRIPPDRLDEDFDAITDELTRKRFEGRVEGGKDLTVLVTNINRNGEGRIVHGDGAIYQNVAFDALVFRPTMQEIVDGTVCEILKFGAFVRFGPLDALLHISQVMDDRVDVDLDNKRLIGKDTKRDVKLNDTVRGRIVAVSINERSIRDSKIGLTMRQSALGKHEWINDERKGAEPEKKKTPKKKGGKKK